MIFSRESFFYCHNVIDYIKENPFLLEKNTFYQKIIFHVGYIVKKCSMLNKMYFIRKSEHLSSSVTVLTILCFVTKNTSHQKDLSFNIASSQGYIIQQTDLAKAYGADC